MDSKILLIIPCFNEAKRLNLAKFDLFRDHIDFIFADDGSTDKTVELLESHNLNVFRSLKNLGKGHVIHECYQHLKKTDQLKNYDWIGYWDADITIPLTTVNMMMKYLEFYPTNRVSAIWSSRVTRLGSNGRDRRHRNFFSRSFSIVVFYLLGIRAHDTQCGAKIFRTEISDKAFESPFISRWIFDLEIYLRLKDDAFIVEYPLTSWVDMGGSKFKLSKESLNIVFDLLKIRFKYRSRFFSLK